MIEIPSRTQLFNPRSTGVAVELGVCEGRFSEEILKGSSFDVVYSIDRWAGEGGPDKADKYHGEEQYRRVVEKLSVFGRRSMIIRASFSEAVKTFDDGYFDFIYIDGYAHNGQEEGQTLWQWWPTLKSGGLFCGHDYDKQMFPKTVKAVDEFFASLGLEMGLTTRDQYASWYTWKP